VAIDGITLEKVVSNHNSSFYYVNICWRDFEGLFRTINNLLLKLKRYIIVSWFVMEANMNMSSDLEFLVETDMIERGYNPYHPDDVELYWENYFNGY